MLDSPIPLHFHAFEIYFQIIFTMKGVFFQEIREKTCFTAEKLSENIWLVI